MSQNSLYVSLRYVFPNGKGSRKYVTLRSEYELIKHWVTDVESVSEPEFFKAKLVCPIVIELGGAKLYRFGPFDRCFSEIISPEQNNGTL